MSKGSYPYPDDEFDAAPAGDAPIGVHRAPRSWWSRWWPFVAVIVIVPLVTVGAVYGITAWSDRDTGGTAAQNTPVPTEPETDDTAPVDGGDGLVDPGAADDPLVGGDVTDGTVPEATAPDVSVPVEVLNAAGQAGLAATTQQRLMAVGYVQVTAGNGDRTAATQSTVFYASADLAPTAQAIATELGIATVLESATQAGPGISVLLLPDYLG